MQHELVWKCRGQRRHGELLLFVKTERTARKVYSTRNQARADVFDYLELFYTPQRRHSTIGYVSPMEFERIAAAS